eukprot:IDg8188t1
MQPIVLSICTELTCRVDLGDIRALQVELRRQKSQISEKDTCERQKPSCSCGSQSRWEDRNGMRPYSAVCRGRRARYSQ